MSFFEQLVRVPGNFTPAAFFPVAVGGFLMFFFIYYIKILKPQKGTVEWIEMAVNKPVLTVLNKRYPMERQDILPVFLITGIFLFFALFNLGNFNMVNIINEIQNPSAGTNHLNNLFFDEIYFVRTAAEHIENMPPYELSHPPLGKLLISASILLFGSSPFGWRVLGALAGVLMITVMYIFVKNMFGKTFVAACTALLFGFDFMRFIQTRIGTIDSYTVFFILCSFFFMYRYITTDVNAPFRKSLLSLAFSGFFFGLSFSVKWIGFYAGAGLLILYIIRLVHLGLFYGSTFKRGFGVYLIKTILFSMLFFVLIPGLVYYFSYIPYGTARGMQLNLNMLTDPSFFNIVRSNQVLMFTYHSRLEAVHPFSSSWWQWILNIRPILYVSNSSGDARAIFGAFGNPVIWWGGFIAMVMTTFRIFTHRDGKSLFILIGFLSQLLPWVAVTRILFIYHYFPSTLFLLLALAHVFNTIIERRGFESGKTAVYAYTAVSGSMFALFYPAMAGFYLPRWFYIYFIKWFPSWPF